MACLPAGEAHDEEGEAILGHVKGAEDAVRSPACLDLKERLLKIEGSKFLATIQSVDSAQHVVMALPKELGHVSAIGEHPAVTDGDDGGGESNIMTKPPATDAYRHRSRAVEISPAGFF